MTSEPSPRDQAHQCPSRGSFLRNSGKLHWVAFIVKYLQSGERYPGVLVEGEVEDDPKPDLYVWRLVRSTTCASTWPNLVCAQVDGF